MTIKIISAEKSEATTESGEIWVCWLKLSNGATTWLLSYRAPGKLSRKELQGYFEGHKEHLWEVAQLKKYPPDFTH